MTATLRAVTWNLYLGGLDGHVQTRLDAQLDILADLAPDVLALQECTNWDVNGEQRLLDTAHRLGMAPALMAPSSIGDGRNFTALLYRPSRLRLLARRVMGAGVFHHALLRALLRPVEAGDDDRFDLLTLATHLSYTDGDTRLREARWLTDYAGDFPQVPARALLMGDLNCPHPNDPTPDWEQDHPRNMWPRYRSIGAAGQWGGLDTRAVRVLLNSGWQDPETLTDTPKTHTVGDYWANEPPKYRLDHILTRGLAVKSYYTQETGRLSDHYPSICDVVLDTPKGAAA
ncbi:endonuclease/exonuclease/phosphatase family protein [Streptomyces sp. NA04227]|uniref:endonuclease/exonuclease/phosphatase family protein n=1 Tax=Streptomyces sp. NA04227 TaxID=2742136 RepID=UPI001590B7ED|nr:endonuclease/exonuclease/phosphatase family protein [Streptomyces sp. NA04227]QKW08028.1 endonuclease/exonuclease/phosphatase family protein [Streptomyces sp. NA04227]